MKYPFHKFFSFAGNRCLCPLFLLLLFLTPLAQSQLSDEALTDLQRQGEEEGWTFTVGRTEASLRPFEHLGTVPFTAETLQEESPSTLDPELLNKTNLPLRFDWRDKVSRPLPPVKDQGSCGSCWAFATTVVMEWAIKIHDDITVDLSEQWLLACNTEVISHDCSGGFIRLGYFKDRKDQCGDSGAVLEKDCPYTGRDNDCNCPYPHHYWIRSYGSLGSFLFMPSVEEIKTALFNYGPLACYVKMSKSFVAYTGGVYNHQQADKAWDTPDHTVVIIGWDDTKNAWIIQNSWGPYWGTNGYGYVQYGVDFIGSSASWVVYGDDLKVSADALDFYGEAGGLPDNQEATILLENTGTETLSWSAAMPEWLQLSGNYGQLPSSGSTTIRASLAPAAQTLERGYYEGSLIITNTTSGAVNAVDVSLTLTPPVLYSFMLDTDPGWAKDPGWAFGRPTGSGSYNGDPSQAYTGANVYGYNLRGNYENNLPERYLTTTALDFSNAKNVQLRFMRWLGVEQGRYDRASVQVSNDNRNWTTLWQNPLSTDVEDTAWTECIYDISAVADGQPQLWVRWVMGSTDYSQAWPGWNIDDVVFYGTLEETKPLHPADTNKNGQIEEGEAVDYLKTWQEGGLSMRDAVRIWFIWKEGGLYGYDEAAGEPMCWIPEKKKP